MVDHVFPKAASDIVATLAEIFRHQNQPDIVELLESANAHIEQTDYDNWNGGTYTYELMLDIPVPVFASVEAKLDEVEKSISAKLSVICRGLSNDHLNSVTITPLAPKATSVGPIAKPADAEVKHIWRDGFLRLFLSHVSAHKIAVAKLKTELKSRGISAFVAHEDITPSLEWQSEIEKALRSMHALAALLTPDFHPSNWTDQEVGFALGRGVLVVPIRIGVDPYGFIGKVQGLTGALNQPSHLASLMSATFLANSSTRADMRKGIVSAFAAAESYSEAITLSKIIATVRDFTDSEKSIIRRACNENSQVFNATGVVARIDQAVGATLAATTSDEAQRPF